MHRLTSFAALAAVLGAVALAGCGGNTTAAAVPEASVPATVQGVSTPPSVSVVTAKNLE